jgi:ubiquinone/menaquinone biosynthesis C-methylase UbiE
MEQPPLGPQTLMQTYTSMLASRALTAAFQLDLFSHLAAGHDTAATLTQAAGSSERGTRMLVDALSAFGFLTKTRGRYEIPPELCPYVVRSSPDYIGALIETDYLGKTWSQLTDAVRTGRPIEAVDKQQAAEAFLPTLITSLHVGNREPARRLAEALCARIPRRGLSILDVACGSAVWSIAFAEADQQASVIAQDFPGVLENTRQFVARHGLAERFNYLPGDLNQVAFGNERFDIAILGNIVHGEGEQSSRRLFARLYPALHGGGRLAIIDFIAAEDRTGPPPVMLFALNMLVHTTAGDTFTLSECTNWLSDAGFESIETINLGQTVHSSAIIATKP